MSPIAEALNAVNTIQVVTAYTGRDFEKALNKALLCPQCQAAKLFPGEPSILSTHVSSAPHDPRYSHWEDGVYVSVLRHLHPATPVPDGAA